MTRNLLRVDKIDVISKMKAAGEIGPQIGKAFAGHKWTHVHPTKRPHVHHTGESNSAVE